jgi:flagellar protein FliL
MKASRILVVLVVIVLLGATGFFGYQYFTSTARGATAAHGQDTTAESGASAQHPSAGSESGEPSPTGSPEVVLYPLKSFVVNLADKAKGRYLKVTLALVVRKSLEERFTKDVLLLASAQDRIITILTSKTVDDLLSVDGKFLLKQEITMQLNTILGEGNVQDVYFADFIIQ